METGTYPAESFTHPMDHRAQRALRSWITSTPTVASRIEALEARALADHRLHAFADQTLVSERQFAGLFDLATQAAEGLRLPERPEVFLQTSPEISAFAIGNAEASHITFNTALLDAFGPAEVRAVAGHELGHVAARHSFYRIVANSTGVLFALFSTIPGGSLAALTLEWLLNDWSSKGELTADRAALIATNGDLAAIQSVIVTLAGGPRHNSYGTFDLDAFEAQARDVRQLLHERREDDSLRGRAEHIASDLIGQNRQRTHQWTALRYLEITEWAASEHYDALRRGDLDEALAIAQRDVASEAPDEDDPPDVEGHEDVVRQAKELGRVASERFRNWRGWSD